MISSCTINFYYCNAWSEWRSAHRSQAIMSFVANLLRDSHMHFAFIVCRLHSLWRHCQLCECGLCAEKRRCSIGFCWICTTASRVRITCNNCRKWKVIFFSLFFSSRCQFSPCASGAQQWDPLFQFFVFGFIFPRIANWNEEEEIAKKHSLLSLAANKFANDCLLVLNIP